MALTIELPPEIEEQLRVAAARTGTDPAELARVAVAEKLTALAAGEEARRRRQLAMLERWNAEDAQRSDDMPEPDIPRLALRVPDIE